MHIISYLDNLLFDIDVRHQIYYVASLSTGTANVRVVSLCHGISVWPILSLDSNDHDHAPHVQSQGISRLILILF